jgi:hypothetical protein
MEFRVQRRKEDEKRSRVLGGLLIYSVNQFRSINTYAGEWFLVDLVLSSSGHRCLLPFASIESIEILLFQAINLLQLFHDSSILSRPHAPEIWSRGIAVNRIQGRVNIGSFLLLDSSLSSSTSTLFSCLYQQYPLRPVCQTSTKDFKISGHMTMPSP